MRAVILTEDSPTTTDDLSTDQLLDYYEGAFGSVRSFAEALPPAYETTFLVHSDEHGCLEASQFLDALDREVDEEDVIAETRTELGSSIDDADLIFISLTKGRFTQIVSEAWDDLISQAQPGSIWGIAAAPSCLDSIDLEDLRSRVGAVATYSRKGVARINQDTREALLEEATARIEA